MTESAVQARSFQLFTTHEGAPFNIWLGGAVFSRHGSGIPAGFSAPRRPVRLDLNGPLFARSIVTKAAPRPVLRLGAQPACHRVAVNVAQLLDPLAFAPHIKVVIALLPERLAGRCQSAGNGLLDRLDYLPKLAAFGLADQQMHMFRHDYVACNKEIPSAARLLQSSLREVAGMRTA